MDATHPLVTWRNAQGLSQADAAQKLELKEPTLCRYELRKRTPSLKQAARLSEITNIPLDAFVNRESAQ